MIRTRAPRTDRARKRIVLPSGRPLCGLLLSSSELRFYSDPPLRWKRDRAGDFFWRRGKALGRPSIRAGAPWHRSPHPVFARRRLRSAVAEAPSNGRFAVRTRRRNGLSAPTRLPFSVRGGLSVYRTRSAGFKAAPSGTTPVSKYCQSAIKSLRASATMPIRRSRLLPWPKRS